MLRFLPRVLPALLAPAFLAAPAAIQNPVQLVAQRALERGIARAASSGESPTAGAAVVLDVEAKTIVAAASTPDAERVRHAYPAGSVVKPIVAVAALQSGPVGRIQCPAVFRAGGATIRNWKHHDSGELSISSAIAESCNTFFAALAARMWETPRTRHTIEATYRAFGFGLPSGLIEGEEPGLAPGPAQSVGDLMELAIGQGPLLVTPPQVARAFAALAGAPQRDWLGETSTPVRITTPVISDPIATPVRRGLIGVVRSGTARKAFRGLALDEVPIAGKTGSAEIGDATPYAWFAGYAPATKPRYVVAVVVERGRRGAVTAAPIARDIFTSILRIPRANRPVFPPAAALALLIPLWIGIASAPAASLIGFVAGFIVVALAGGSGPAGGIAFAGAGWLAGKGRRPFGFAAAAAAGSLGFPFEGQGLAWIALRAVVTASIGFAFGVMAMRLRVGERVSGFTR